MSDFNDQPLSEDAQKKLYSDLESAVGGDDVCDAAEMILVPDTDPVFPADKCLDNAEPLPADFFSANQPPPPPEIPDSLPDPISVVSREVSLVCPSGQVALAGNEPSIAPAGADIQLVYLDEIENIAQTELFRLAAYVDDLQAHVTANLDDAVDAADFVTFDQIIVSVTGTTPAIAERIRNALVAAHTRAAQIAQAIALAGVVCGWRNQELWVTCQSADPGYAVSFFDPGDVEKARRAANAFSSTISQADANEQAAKAAALELACLVTNQEQTVSCSAVEGEVSETTALTWPSNWLKASSPRAAAIGTEVVTLTAQGAATWSVTAWDDFETNTETISLNALNGQEFIQPDRIGASARRILRTTVTIEAGDPRTAAPDLATANAIAYNLAVAELDCFIPNRPRIISCVTPDYGSVEVTARHAGRGLGIGNISRGATFAELLGGDPEIYGGPPYERANVGIIDFDLPTEQEDSNLAFEVYVWPGYFSGESVSVVEDVAGNYGAERLQCLWVSPQHGCTCVSTAEEAAIEFVTAPGQTSARFSTETLEIESARLDSSRSTDPNSLPRGFVTDSAYPNRVADPSYTVSTLRWPLLAEVCQSGLNCIFTACKTACCEPKPDTRPFRSDGAINYATWEAYIGAATSVHQTAFMAAWEEALAASTFEGCEGYSGSDSCNISSPPTYGDLDSIVARGPGTYGTPARFKYGGLLQWGAQWQEPSLLDPNTPIGEEGEPPPLYLAGTVKACHKDVEFVQIPDEWGLFHCAEGFVDGSTPIGLGEQARQAAIDRLDCTHISWPRRVSCPVDLPAQGDAAGLNLVVEGSSTLAANAQLEAILQDTVRCQREPSPQGAPGNDGAQTGCEGNCYGYYS